MHEHPPATIEHYNRKQLHCKIKDYEMIESNIIEIIVNINISNILAVFSLLFIVTYFFTIL